MNKILISLCATLLLFYTQPYASTFEINPDMAIYMGYDSRDVTSFNRFSLNGPYYVCDVGTGERTGYEQNDYYETFFSPQIEPSGATVSYTAGSKIGPYPITIAVTGIDVGLSPAWYLIPAYKGFVEGVYVGWWNRTDDLVLSGFWPEQGSIASIAFYTPEPSTILLAGIGLIGLAGYCRRRLFA